MSRSRSLSPLRRRVDLYHVVCYAIDTLTTTTLLHLGDLVVSNPGFKGYSADYSTMRLKGIEVVGIRINGKLLVPWCIYQVNATDM